MALAVQSVRHSLSACVCNLPCSFPGPHGGTGNGSHPSHHLGAGDTTVQPGSVLDEHGTAADKEICRNKTDQINWSDMDLVELPPAFTRSLGLQGPAVYVVWICGDQDPGFKSPNFGLLGDSEWYAGPVAAVLLLIRAVL